MRDTRPDYPPEYDEVVECVGCGDEFPNTIAAPDHPLEPLENNCCSWECYAITLKERIRELRKLRARDFQRRKGLTGRNV